jgi:hypothetical protein
MPLSKGVDGTWHLEFGPDEQDQWNPAYAEALPRYLTALDRAFSAARARSEFEFLASLLRVRGVQAAGWDPFETTVRAIPAILAVQQGTQDFEVARHLLLWLYAHTLEASEPYEILANLLDVVQGGRFKVHCFPAIRGRPPSPEYKIRRIAERAAAVNLAVVMTPLNEVWNREFRNAIAHADYTLHGGEVRTTRPVRTYPHEQVMALINRTLAYHEAFVFIFRHHIQSYTTPVAISVHPGFSDDPQARAVVIVREGEGAVGLKDGWSPAQIAAGKIPWRLARLYPSEVSLLMADPTRALLPPRPSAGTVHD